MGSAESYADGVMGTIPAKPRLIFFQYRYHPGLPAFVLTHKQEHVKCLSQFFEVTVIQDDCDFEQVCDTHEPDVALFEGGVPFPYSRRPAIEHTDRCGRVPKIGLFHSDGFAETRAAFLSDMDRWGVETFFAIATTAAEHLAEAGSALYTWPVFVDTDIHRDYGESKRIPVLFTGNSTPLYPWRQQIVTVVAKRYPSLICPHPGYAPVSTGIRVVVGESYARLLNASWFVPACGTVAREAVRKHFEIPACRACLVTERSAALEAAGFRDMENCVFAEPQDVLDKLDHLATNPDVLQRVIDAGYELVHRRHTLLHRDQIAQWYTLQKGLRPHQHIVQTNPFGPLTVADRAAHVGTRFRSGAIHLNLLREAHEMFWSGRLDEAERLYRRCAAYIPWMPEPQLGLGLCCLARGDARGAVQWIEKPLKYTLSDYNAPRPDPVEWAAFITCQLCLGRVGEAARCSSEFSSLRHPDLDFARWAAAAANGGTAPSIPTSSEETPPSHGASIHSTPARGFAERLNSLVAMLTACRQQGLAERLARSVSSSCREQTAAPGAATQTAQAAMGGMTRTHGTAAHLQSARDEKARRRFKRHLLYPRIAEAARQRLSRLRTVVSPVRNLLHKVERRYGHFLPDVLSSRTGDSVLCRIEALAAAPSIKNALIIGAQAGDPSAQAMLRGLRVNASGPRLFGLADASGASGNAIAMTADTRWYGLGGGHEQSQESDIADTISLIKQQNNVDRFELVVIEASTLGPSLASAAVLEQHLRPDCVVIADVTGSGNWDAYYALALSDRYRVVEHNLAVRQDYAVLEANETPGTAGDVFIRCADA